MYLGFRKELQWFIYTEENRYIFWLPLLYSDDETRFPNRESKNPKITKIVNLIKRDFDIVDKTAAI